MPKRIIFDRHPVISQSIYGPIAGGVHAPPYLLQELKRLRPFVIETYSENKGEHIIKAHDTPHHLKMLKEKRGKIKRAYKTFLNEHFPERVIYTFKNLDEVMKLALAYARKLSDF